MRALFAGLAVSFALCALSSSAGAAEPQERFSDIRPIELKAGLNTVHDFTPSGGDGAILLGWRGNGNAHGYNLYSVFDVSSGGANVVGFDNMTKKGGAFDDVIRDAPHTLEDYVRSIRFAKAKLDGKDGMFAFVATRRLDPEEGIPGPSLVDYTVYQLVDMQDNVGTTPLMFKPVATQTSTGKFCNSDMALFRQFGIALGSNYAGTDKPDGC